MEASSNRKSWRLKSYSRLKAGEKGSGENEENQKFSSEWLSILDKDDNPLYLHLDLTARLSITNGTTILENFFLVDSSKWLKGFWNRTELIISYKCGDKARVFKQEFDGDGGRQNCTECAKLLRSFFPVSAVDEELMDEEQNQSSLLPIDPFVSQICSSILTGQTLPEVYRNCNYDITNSEEDMENFVVTCLTDPNFPAFVAEIEKAMDRIIGN